MTIKIEEHLQQITERIITQKPLLAEKRHIAANQSYTNKTQVDIKLWREKLINIYAQSISTSEEHTFETLQEWGKETVNLWANLNLNLETAIEEVRYYRSLIGEIIKKTANDFSLSIDVFYDIISKFDAVVDRAVYWLSMSYSKQFNQRILSAESAAEELSIPIVRITEKLGVIPLIGIMDTNRAQKLMHVSITSASNLELEHIIFDLSGVPIIDTMVAKQLFDVIEALQLVGISAKISGIRPEIAQTMVSLGVSFKVKTYSSLHLAVKEIH
ncbi:STAS domain-containing protein [Cytobacillus sp. FSL R7-0696]|uniref:STAS domain-containing protein n=1 Tax=Cytobacillus sp. FSL R7-0696 TaxID=2921691 RepID=UPI0030FB3739